MTSSFDGSAAKKKIYIYTHIFTYSYNVNIIVSNQVSCLICKWNCKHVTKTNPPNNNVVFPVDVLDKCGQIMCKLAATLLNMSFRPVRTLCNLMRTSATLCKEHVVWVAFPAAPISTKYNVSEGASSQFEITALFTSATKHES